ncbi:hypothetical protein [Pararobbsia alpina]|uniref:Uncharacterized protein n=1 Tax=Pararobbsia alpina TaxID=621374 RepID=A0A6S7BUS8_9BURK|nr:hypothetical protein [Pararobbsia alpina]CAB3803434.1 hypothetical protein LMG28138_05352 [Pararobbsia alpina]
MIQPHIRTFLIASAAFLALEVGPVFANMNARPSPTEQRAGEPRPEESTLTAWMPGQLFNFPKGHKTRRDCD